MLKKGCARTPRVVHQKRKSGVSKGNLHPRKMTPCREPEQNIPAAINLPNNRSGGGAFPGRKRQVRKKSETWSCRREFLRRGARESGRKEPTTPSRSDESRGPREVFGSGSKKRPGSRRPEMKYADMGGSLTWPDESVLERYAERKHPDPENSSGVSHRDANTHHVLQGKPS